MPRATARRREGYTHDVEVDGHTVVSDEPESAGGADQGPSPTRLLAASLASCTAITVEMYADRKGWDLGALEVVVDMEYDRPPIPRSFLVTLKLPKDLSEEQRERIRVIAGRCPVHRVLVGDVEVSIEDRIELV
jgi:putative redox protein